MLFGKLFRFLKEKADHKLYEEIKLLLSDELKSITNGAEVFKREDSLSQILEVINNIAKNSRNIKYNSDTREDMQNTLDNFREKKKNLNTSSDVRVLREDNIKIIEGKNTNPNEKDLNAKNLKLSFDFSNRINNLIANSKNISCGDAIETTDLKQVLKDSANAKSKVHVPGTIKPPVQSTVGVNKNDTSNKYTQNVNHKASLYNLIKGDNSLISKIKNSKTQSNSKSKSQSREDSNTRSGGINSLPGSKSKSKQTRNNVVFDNVRRETVNLNKIPLTTTNRAIQNQPLLNGKLFMKLNSVQKKEPSLEVINLGSQHQGLGGISAAFVNSKLAANKKINLSTGIRNETQGKRCTSNTAKRNVNYSEIASKERSLNAISPTKLKRNVSEVEKQSLGAKDSKSAQVIQEKKPTVAVKNNFLEMTYASKIQKEKVQTKQGELKNGTDLIEIQGEGMMKNSEVLQEIKQSLDDNLKGMFNFSYENFLNKESESEERYSTKKSNDVSENEIISQVEPNVDMSY